jgi:hypothetical protein
VNTRMLRLAFTGYVELEDSSQFNEESLLQELEDQADEVRSENGSLVRLYAQRRVWSCNFREAALNGAVL